MTKRFIVESVSIIDDCNEDKSRITKVITDKEEIYSYNDLYEIVELLNELYEDNRQLKVLLKDSEDQVETLKESNKKLIESLVQKESED